MPLAGAAPTIPVSRPSFGSEERALLLEAFDSGWITAGPMVRRFETEFARALGVAHAVAVTSGTTALHLACAALGLGPGDEVIVPDLTYVATANAVAYTGARPVFVDIDPTTYGMDVSRAARAITRRTRALIPVHLYGHAADMAGILVLARMHNLFVIEDAAEGLGGSYEGQALGTLSTAGCFSFFGNKVMTTGEGGMIVTHDDALAHRLRHLRGMATHPTRRYVHTEIGFNYRMTDLQAAIGIGQLHALPEHLARRRAIVERYVQRLHQHVTLPTTVATSAPWLFTCEVPERDAVMAHLAARGIETRPTFVPMHEVFHRYHGHWPIADRVSRHGLSLPTYPDLALDDVDHICSEVRACV